MPTHSPRRRAPGMTAASSELHALDPAIVELLLLGHAPHYPYPRFDALEFVIDGSAERAWTEHRAAVVAEARRRNIACCWAERIYDRIDDTPDGEGEA